MSDKKLLIKLATDVSQLKSGMKQARKEVSNFQSKIKETGKDLMTAFGIGIGLETIRELGGQIVKLTGEYQRYKAVLTNTLGSETVALGVMERIKDFAASTPFEINELTAAFVKLANQGFVPTTEELRKLGDLSASVGKSFDQLTEAIIDAQTGEFERLKEFGIRASKEGDKVTFTFKGVQTQTEFTSQAIRDYILSLGTLQGVSGSMAAISATLEGRISNLKDSWDQLMTSMGESNSGAMYAVVQAMADLVNTMQLMGAFFEQFRTGFDGLSDKSLDAILNFADTDSGKNVKEVLKPILEMDNDQFFANPKKSMHTFVKLLTDEGEEMSEVLTLWNRYLAIRVESTKNAKEEASVERKKAVLAEIERQKQRQRYIQELKEKAPKHKALPEEDKAKINTGELSDYNVTTAQYFNPAMAEANRIIEWMRSAEKEISPAAEKIKTVFVDMGQTIEASLENSAVAIGDAIGDMASGLGGIELFASALLNSVAEMLAQLGRLAIATGIAMKGIKLAFKNPATAIAAGIAAIALSRVVAAKAQAIASGGGGGVGGSDTNIERLSSIQSRNQGVIQVTGTLKGRDIEIQSVEQRKVTSRTKANG